MILTDRIRRRFLDELERTHEIEPTEWERDFCRDNLLRHEFTYAQRNAIDRMHTKYAFLIRFTEQ